MASGINDEKYGLRNVGSTVLAQVLACGREYYPKQRPLTLIDTEYDTAIFFDLFDFIYDKVIQMA